MQTQTSMMIQTAAHTRSGSLKLARGEQGNTQDLRIDPMTLAYLDFGLFKSMCKLGVSRERICSALTISHDDFEYICNLSSA
ncbi:MAG: hypothetical protein V7459_15895 [Oceanicoccus sp.]